MKTYEWMVGPRGNAHFCERRGPTDVRPVCGKPLAEFIAATAEPKCPACVKASGVILRYAEVMRGNSETK